MKENLPILSLQSMSNARMASMRAVATVGRGEVRLIVRSHQKRLERPQRPAAIHFQCTLATRSDRSDWRRERLKLTDAQLYANEQWRDRGDSQWGTDVIDGLLYRSMSAA